MKHKIPAIGLLFLLFVLGLSACASETSDTESPVPTQAEPPIPAPAEAPAFHPLAPSDAQEMMASDTAFVLLDVREPSEFAEGHIPGATLMPLGTLHERAPLEILDKDMQIIIYCRSGRRSVDAAEILLALGFQNVFDLGGILNWPYEIQLPE